MKELLKIKPYTRILLVIKTLIQEVMATRSKQGNAKSKPPNDGPVITADVARPTGVDAALWELILSHEEDTAAM